MFLKSALAFSFLFMNSHSAQATLRLDNPSYFNRTHIDAAYARANLNFIYEGCDANPSPDNIKLKTDGKCADAKNFNLAINESRTAVSGKVGIIDVDYEGGPQTCASKTKSKLYVNRSLRDLYQEFKKNGCTPSHLMIRDGDQPDDQFIPQELANKRLCELPPVRISKPNFPTDNHDFFNLKATDRGFQIGGHTQYSFDHQRKVWCVKYKQNAENCGEWPSPLPLAYKDKTDGKFHLKGVVSLSPDGKASIKSINKKYDTEAAIFEDQKKGAFNMTDRDQGRIDFQTWRKKNGVVRSIVRSFEKDTPNGQHQRAVNFMGRNLFGIGVTKAWCPGEHCFADGKGDELKDSLCKGTEKIDMVKGGTGNVCHSCVGITPGHCAIERSEVDMVKKALKQENGFMIMSNGEYRPSRRAEAGLMRNLTHIKNSPTNPGCHAGYAPAFNDLFDPGEALRTNEGRSVQQKDETL